MIHVNVAKPCKSKLGFMDDKPTIRNAIFQSAPLKPTSARRAYALVRLFNPQMDLPDWLTYARSFARHSARSAGLHALEDERGYIHAVFAYNVRHHLRHRRLLRVTDVVIGHLPGRTLAEALLGSVADIAQESACDSVMVELGEASLARDALRQAGFAQTEMECFLADRALKQAALPA